MTSQSNTTLQWKNLTVNITKTNTQILKNISGSIKPGESLAILGGSGSGKTTFLNYLSKRSTKEGLTKVKGNVDFIYNQQEMNNDYINMTGYVTQDDILQPFLTPNQIFKFGVDLKMSQLNQTQKDNLINKLIEDLMLDKCKDTMIGDVEIKGISGGERKRTAIGYELITDPKILFLDEPTTGLDSVTAKNVIEIILKEAKIKKRIVIFTIHQPSSSIFSLFDNVMVLVNGFNVYSGKRRNILSFYSKFNLICPTHANPAEFIISATKVLSRESIISQKEEEFDESNLRICVSDEDELYIKMRDENEIAYNLIDKEEKIEKIEDVELNSINHNQTLSFLTRSKKKPGFLNELSILLKREYISLLKNPLVFWARLGTAFLNSLLIISTFINLGKGDTSFIDRQSLLFFTVNLNISINLQLSLLVFIKDKVFFYKENENNMYNLSNYILSKFIINLPGQVLITIMQGLIIYFSCNLNMNQWYKFPEFLLILFLSSVLSSFYGLFLSSFIENLEVAPSILGPVLFLQTMAGGYFLKYDDLPIFLKPIYYISIYKYSLEPLYLIEFTDMDNLQCNNPAICENPIDLVDVSFTWFSVILAGYSLIMIFLTYVTFKIKIEYRNYKSRR